MGKRSKKKIEIKTIQESRPYVLWRRVSTTSQGADGLGIAAQLTIAKMFMGKDPVEVFTDVYSGTKLKQCVGLWKAIDYCKQNGTVLVVAKSDRFRNVQEALDVVDSIGERNLILCDIPTTDRFVLTVMWAMWERQALMGRVNTKIALAERKRQIRENGGFMSKSGNYCTKIGNPKGCDTSAATSASAKKKAEYAAAWRETSPLYAWVTIQLLRNKPRKEILDEAAELYEKDPVAYGTRHGKPMSPSRLTLWAQEILVRN